MGHKALVVEDEVELGQLLAEHLRRWGFEPTVLNEGKNVIDWVRVNQPDLILLDLLLPDMDGFTICETLKLDRETNLMPIIMVTALSANEEKVRGLQVGANRYLTKPFTADELHRAIQDAFDWQQDLQRRGTEGEIRFQLLSDFRYLEELNHLLGSLFLFSGLDQKQVKQLTTAVRELGTNAIEWGHKKQVDRVVTVDYHIDPHKIAIIIKDTGPGFDPKNLPHAAQSDDPIGHMMVRETLGLRDGGFGILMSRGLVDELEYNDAGNEVRLVKYFPARTNVDKKSQPISAEPKLTMARWFLALALLLATLGCGRPAAERIVVYCAHDREFAEAILNDFAKKTGLQVLPRFDTEANKAVGLYEDLVREASRPKCDVHWNNEILATLRLASQGIYEAYESPAAKPFPAVHKATDHTWTAFAARARVLLVHTRVQKEDRPRTYGDLTDPRWHGKVVMAKPQFGTTATHAACLFEVWGEAKATDFFAKLNKNDVRILPGNKNVAVAVGKGDYDVGLTDTDDAVAELQAGHPVEIIFPDETLFIPNTVAMIKNCPNPTAARQLIDYLLSPEVESKLAQSASRQIPLNPEVKSPLPQEVELARSAKPLQVNFANAAGSWQRAQKLVLEALR